LGGGEEKKARARVSHYGRESRKRVEGFAAPHDDVGDIFHNPGRREGGKRGGRDAQDRSSPLRGSLRREEEKKERKTERRVRFSTGERIRRKKKKGDEGIVVPISCGISPRGGREEKKTGRTPVCGGAGAGEGKKKMAKSVSLNLYAGESKKKGLRDLADVAEL